MATGPIKQVTNNSVDGYCKMPDGTLIQWGKTSISRNAGQNSATVNYQIPFISEPSVTATYSATHPEIWFCSAEGSSTTQITLYMYNSGTTASGSGTVKWLAIGRWK